MEIIEYSVIELIDPTGILSGKRFEFKIYVRFDEEDELYTEQGTGVRIIYTIDGELEKVASYQLFDRATETYLDFGLEEDEETALSLFCKEHFIS